MHALGDVLRSRLVPVVMKLSSFSMQFGFFAAFSWLSSLDPFPWTLQLDHEFHDYIVPSRFSTLIHVVCWSLFHIAEVPIFEKTNS